MLKINLKHLKQCSILSVLYYPPVHLQKKTVIQNLKNKVTMYCIPIYN